jgi:endonuclease YncB( thermonuclease family)
MKSKKKPVLTGIAGLIAIGVIAYLEQPNKYAFPIKRVIDGDTIEIEAPFLPEELKRKLSVRVVGIDTPEKGSLAKCDLERDKSLRAKQFVESEMIKSKEIKVVIKSWDKYGGRVLGDFILDGQYLSKKMIDNGFAVEYYGEKKSKDWCSK